MIFTYSLSDYYCYFFNFYYRWFVEINISENTINRFWAHKFRFLQITSEQWIFPEYEVLSLCQYLCL